MVPGSQAADDGAAGVTLEQVAEAVSRRRRAFALDAHLCGLRHVIDRLHEEADALPVTIHLPGGDKLSAGFPVGALLQLLNDQEEAPAADVAPSAEAAPVAFVPTPAAPLGQAHVVLFGAAPVTLVVPFTDQGAAAVWGREWQAANGDNPCWQCIDVPADVSRFAARLPQAV
jgi:hypothetical protein